MKLALRAEAQLAPSMIVWPPGKVSSSDVHPLWLYSRCDRQAALWRMAVQAAIDAIFRAACKGDAVDVARRLGLQPDLLESRTTSYAGSLVYQAAVNGHADVIRVLIGKGADVNSKSQYSWTPIDAAVWGGHEEVVDLLLGARAELKQTGWTTLMRACAVGHLGVILRLLQYMRVEGLNVRRPHTGSTALILACIYRQVKVTRALLLAGADDTIADDRGRTPRQIAQRSRFHPCRAVFQVGA
jgi:cytohesin